MDKRTRFLVVDSTTGAQVERLSSVIQARATQGWLEQLTHRPHHVVCVMGEVA